MVLLSVVLCHTACVIRNKAACCAAVAISEIGAAPSSVCIVSPASIQFMASKGREGREDRRGRVE